MAAREGSLRKIPLFTMMLSSAVLEWLLIFLLFIHAIFSYSITKFARYCNLQVPCLLCSRLDHILGSEKNGFYWDLICQHHKLEISSLVVCHVHNKLVDVHNLCENCLFSFATRNKSKAETYSLLVGKLGENSPLVLDEDQFEDKKMNNKSKRICSCCNDPYILRNLAQNLLSSHSDFDDLKNTKEQTRALNGFDHLPQVEYSKVKCVSDTESEVPLEYSKVKNFSDSESEVPFSDDDDGIALIRESAELRDFVVKSVPMVPRVVTLPDYSISEKLIHTDSISEVSPLNLQGQTCNNDPEGSKYVSSPMDIRHGLKEVSWLHAQPKEVPQVSDLLVTSVKDKKVCVDGTGSVESEKLSSKKVTSEKIKPITEREISSYVENKVTDTIHLEQRIGGNIRVEEKNPAIKTSSENITCEETKPVLKLKASPKIPSVVNDEFTETVEPPQTISEKVTHEGKNPVIESEASLDTPSVVNDKITETVKLEPISREKVTHEKTKPVIEGGSSSESVNDSITQLPNNLELSEAYEWAVGNKIQLSQKESSKTADDLKLLLSQLSDARGIDHISPRLSGNFDEMRINLMLHRTSLERNESGLSLDGSLIGEIEGESEVDRLKRQVEHDKRVMEALHKELEEERSASAVSANQTMAMITRLQEEKASLKMEALQCVRMMEEQAEYDVEALQKANDLLDEKEKEIQDLEADLEFLKSKLENLEILEGEMESTCGLEARESAAEQSDSNNFKNSENVDSNSTVDKPHAFSKDDLTYSSYSEFEDERLFFLECLRKLEKKLHLYDGVNLDLADTANSRKKEEKESTLNKPNCKEGTQEIISSREKEKDCVAIGDAVSYLIKKLEAPLEVDSNGIDHSFKSLKREDEKIKQQSGNSFAPQSSAKQ